MASDNGELLNVHIICEWENCGVSINSKREFHDHVKQHLPQLQILTDNNGEESYKCLWLNCLYQTQDPEDITWHVKYHGYHTVLKIQGELWAVFKRLPPCTLSTSDCNTIPNRTLPLVCQWESCEERCTGQVEFIDHVNFCHISFLRAVPKERLKCQWTDCVFSTVKKSNLTEHVKMHSGDKAFACSHCGQMFANSTKFVNHRNRQLPLDEHSPQCSHCLVFLPNERLLKIHMRQHVHHYKCCFCDLTCSTPSILSAHIKYRHLPYKPFKCSSCSHVCKSQTDLNRHMTVHSDNFFACTHEGCSASYRTEISLARHFEKVHTENPQLHKFICHLCTKTYTRGSKLTNHLCSVHNVTKPSGYSRFEYRREEDGYFRLQTTRLESLEVEEMSFAESVLKQSSIGCSSEDEQVDDPEAIYNNTKPLEEANKTVTIDIIDDEGKIITTNVVTTEIELPPEAKVVAVGK